MGKYDVLRRHLEKQAGALHGMGFEEIDDLVGGLPPSAFQYREWWANEESGRHVQAHAWMGAGWRVDRLELSLREVVFRRID